MTGEPSNQSDLIRSARAAAGEHHRQVARRVLSRRYGSQFSAHDNFVFKRSANLRFARDARYDSGVRIAVVGGGINGAGVTWELARKGYEVTLFERSRCGEQTSSATTKMIHGGLRYLEALHVGLVRESLRDRAWLLEHLPELVKPMEILLPIYKDSPRSRFTIKIGLILYEMFLPDVTTSTGISRSRLPIFCLAHHSFLRISAAASLTGMRRSTTQRSSAPLWPPPAAMARPFGR